MDAFDSGDTVRIACVFEGQHLIGLLPVIHSGDYYGYPVPHYRTWLHANAFCGAPLVARGEEEVFWEALLDWADGASASALFLHLAGLPEDGPLYAALAKVTGRMNRPSAIVMREERALLFLRPHARGIFRAIDEREEAQGTAPPGPPVGRRGCPDVRTPDG